MIALKCLEALFHIKCLVDNKSTGLLRYHSRAKYYALVRATFPTQGFHEHPNFSLKEQARVSKDQQWELKRRGGKILVEEGIIA